VYLEIPTRKHYADLVVDIKTILSPFFPLMTTKSEEVNLGGGNGYVFATYIYTIDQLYILIAMKNLTTGVLNYKLLAIEEIGAKNVVKEVVSLIIHTCPSREENEYILMTKIICESIKMSIEQLKPSMIKEHHITYTEDTKISILFLLDNYIDLTSENLIRETVHRVLRKIK
jgi:hypothetical protein